ncbi:lumican [Latimeria chalumnae]|uniref:Lumican n=1 Tax=Latimeria chalumnae TaxID=7897 RepID=H2ZW54_LATCH|nr:PREDICTED: lumican [Latimeria chalumnae]|eukprot:XP_006009488.1 PREDICTED: lumican [Latimeria chalumnae]
MNLNQLPLFAILISGIFCQYEYFYQEPDYSWPASQLGPSSPHCPEECDCPINFPSAMYCDNRKLKYIPIVPAAIKYLYLQNNLLEGIPDGVFDNATELSWLILDNNQIVNSKVGKNALSKLKSMTRLFINYNNLTEPIGPLPKTMNELKLAYNQIKKITPNVLEGLENLTIIHLHSNELQDDSIAGAFKGLKSLTYLDLSHNKLAKLPSGLPSGITTLYFDHNNIKNIPDEYFQRFSNLQYLRISYNKLTDGGIPGNAFNISTIIELDLSFNKLNTIPSVNEYLQNLYLQVNEINSFTLSSFCKVVSLQNFSRIRHLRLDGNNITQSSLPHDVNNCLRQATEVTI